MAESEYICKNIEYLLMGDEQEKKDRESGGVSVEELERMARRRLSAKYGEGEGAAMTRLLFHALKGWDRTQLMIHGDREASAWLRQKIEEGVERVLGGEPVQYVAGEAYFYGMDFKVCPGVLIPRPETAELVDMIVKSNTESDLRVLDVGCGSGAIAIALSRNLRFPQVTALDISETAVRVTAENAAALHARIDIVRADIFNWQPAPGSLDIVVSNPPYIAESERADMESHVSEHEPAQALFVPDDNPLVYYSRISDVAREGLVAGGRLYFEINPRYASDLERMLAKEGWRQLELTSDSYGRTRFVSAVK